MSYDIETADPKLGKYLSDGKTMGIRIPNVLAHTDGGRVGLPIQRPQQRQLRQRRRQCLRPGLLLMG
jgi:hypothetical protein